MLISKIYQRVPFSLFQTKEILKKKEKLIGNIQRVQQLGREAFEGKEHINFGKIDAKGWNNMFANHLNHHLSQFGV